MEEWLSRHIFNLVIAIAIPVILFGFVYTHSDSTSFNQEFYVRDIALTINSMLSVEGELIISYYIPSKFEVSIEKKIVKEKLQDNVVVTVKNYPVAYPYISSKDFDIALEKKGELIVIQKIKKHE